MSLHIVFVEPQIPPNTGNIARTCAATDTVLHLVEPLGFSIDEKSVKRAGLDYWPFVKLEVHASLDAFMEKYGQGDRRLFLATTKGGHVYSDVQYQDGDMFLFGKETAGLPEKLLYENPETTVRIPMIEEARSLNLSNSVAIGVYEVLRQWDYPELSAAGNLRNYKWDE